MISFQCPECSKKFQVDDGKAGQKGTCRCGAKITIPALTHQADISRGTSAVCPGCREPVMPTWRSCPICSVPLKDAGNLQPQPTNYAQTAASADHPSGSAEIQAGDDAVVRANVNKTINTAGAVPPGAEVQAGDNSVVKATIDKTTNIAGGAGSQTSSPTDSQQSLINVGSDAVVKANINQTTNIDNSSSVHQHGQFVENQTVDRSTNIDQSSNVHHHGQYVEQQTVVVEASVSSMVQLLTGQVSEATAKQIEDALPEDPDKLFAILAQTLRHVLREAKRRFANEGILNMMFSAPGGGFSSMLTMKKEEKEAEHTKKERMKLCKKILDKLSDIAHTKNDATLIQDVDTLDDCLITTERMLPKQGMLRMVNVFSYLGLFGIFVFGIGAFSMKDGGTGLMMFLLYSALAGGGYFIARMIQKHVCNGISNCFDTVNELAQRRNAQ